MQSPPPSAGAASAHASAEAAWPALPPALALPLPPTASSAAAASASSSTTAAASPPAPARANPPPPPPPLRAPALLWPPLRRLPVSGLLLTALSCAVGCTGTFVPVSFITGSATYTATSSSGGGGGGGASGGWALGYRITQSLLATCAAATGCAALPPSAPPAATAAACSALPAALTAGCWSNFQQSPAPGQAGALGSAPLTAGFFFDCGAWLVDASALALCAYTLAAAARAAPESGALLKRWALPGALAFSIWALLFRCAALGCNWSGARAQWMAGQPAAADAATGALAPAYPLPGQATPGIVNFGVKPVPPGLALAAASWAYSEAPGAALLLTATVSSALQVAAYAVAIAAVRAHVAVALARRAADAARKEADEAAKASALL